MFNFSTSLCNQNDLIIELCRKFLLGWLNILTNWQCVRQYTWFLDCQQYSYYQRTAVSYMAVRHLIKTNKQKQLPIVCFSFSLGLWEIYIRFVLELMWCDISVNDKLLMSPSGMIYLYEVLITWSVQALNTV